MSEKEEYQSAVYQCALAAKMLRLNTDLPALLQAIDRADTLGPILDPTLWRDKHKAMQQDKELFEAALPLWRFAEKLLSEDEREAHPQGEQDG